MVASPFCSFCLWIFIDWIFKFISYWLLHHTLHFIHPIFNILFVGIDLFHKVNLFLFSWKHGNDCLFVVELNCVDIFKHFLQVRLHCRRFFSLRKNLEKIVVRKEVKSGKFLSFLLQILVQWFLNVLQLLISVSELIKKSLCAAHLHYVRVLFCQNHICLPYIINTSEFFAFSWQLLGDISGVKDWLKIHPVSLAFHPFFHHIRNCL